MRTVSTKLPEEEADELDDMVQALRFAGLFEGNKSEYIRKAIREKMEEEKDAYEDMKGLRDQM